MIVSSISYLMTNMTKYSLFLQMYKRFKEFIAELFLQNSFLCEMI